jgi:hypothetical protein
MCRAETKNSRAMTDTVVHPCRYAKRFGVRALQRRFEERWDSRKVRRSAQRSKRAQCAQLIHTHRSRAKAALKRTHSKALRATIPNPKTKHNVQSENQNPIPDFVNLRAVFVSFRCSKQLSPFGVRNVQMKNENRPASDAVTSADSPKLKHTVLLATDEVLEVDKVALVLLSRVL